jgi:hypothetical protein
MIMRLSSLRAQRSNPDFGAVAKLLRHFATRNDEALLVFVPSRETAKARGKIGFGIAGLLIAVGLASAPTTVEACPKTRYFTSEADVIFVGTGVLTESKGGGLVRVQKRIKGKAAKFEFVQVDFEEIGYDCSEIFGLRPGRQNTGKFYLTRSKTGELHLIQFFMHFP